MQFHLQEAFSWNAITASAGNVVMLPLLLDWCRVDLTTYASIMKTMNDVSIHKYLFSCSKSIDYFVSGSAAILGHPTLDLARGLQVTSHGAVSAKGI